MPSLYFKENDNEAKPLRVGDKVEVYCDHDDDDDNRIREWLLGVVVQIDPKIVAVQFRESVYLTDGWMVPDHVLWCPKNSPMIRRAREVKKRRRSES